MISQRTQQNNIPLAIIPQLKPDANITVSAEFSQFIADESSLFRNANFIILKLASFYYVSANNHKKINPVLIVKACSNG
jgi:hypothetical protein